VQTAERCLVPRSAAKEALNPEFVEANVVWRSEAGKEGEKVEF